jgi:hypothetical protein
MENSDDSDDDVGPAFDEFFETAFGLSDSGKVPLERIGKFFPREITDR